MDVFNLIGAAVGLDAVYRSKKPRLAPPTKPRLCLFPKWVRKATYPEDVRTADDFAEALAARLKPLGFAAESVEAGAASFTRGSVVGDFSAKAAKVRLTFDPPGSAGAKPGAAHARAEYLIALPLFDTGDLWTLLNDAVALVEAAPAAPAPAAPADAPAA